MGRCKICVHPNRADVEDRLVAGGYRALPEIDEWRLELHVAHTPALLQRVRETLGGDDR